VLAHGYDLKHLPHRLGEAAALLRCSSAGEGGGPRLKETSEVTELGVGSLGPPPAPKAPDTQLDDPTGPLYREAAAPLAWPLEASRISPTAAARSRSSPASPTSPVVSESGSAMRGGPPEIVTRFVALQQRGSWCAGDRFHQTRRRALAETAQAADPPLAREQGCREARRGASRSTR